ncbi:MAG TPA: trans-4-hydroxy-L-proline dehydratase [Candidatus Limnocylindrales bacterium]|nr:trans-4-hydroxy-L-proline dehydratase [Candidatus Limnocylindrales bacterium]
MNARVAELRERSVAARPSVSAERSLILTRFYSEHWGRHATPVLRAMAFRELCENKTITIEPGELVVGERGPAPKVTPLFPELTCHSTDDLRILDSRPLTSYDVPEAVVDAYADEVIPYWRGRTLRDRIMARLPAEWHEAYEAGVFTEFMEQRAPGHTVADGKIYAKGMDGFVADVDAAAAAVDIARDPLGGRRLDEWQAMRIAAGAAVRFAERHAELAEALARDEADPGRRAELVRIAEICRRVPAQAPCDFWEAIQMYWFCHLGVITELNGWDAYSPGHLDQHLEPFYQRGIADGSLTRERAKELLGCLFVKFNNHPAPPKVGVTAAESGTYTDFAGIALGGIRRDGTDGVGDVSYLLLEVIDELHLVQPSPNVQLSRVTPEHFLRETCKVVRHGYGYPALFNADGVVTQLLRKGKSVEDAREGGTSGCVETGAYGKEAYVLTGYFNLPKILELTLNDGRDPRTGRQLGPRTGDPRDFATYAELFAAWTAQLNHFVDSKIRGNALIERMVADAMPAPFLSLITSDCITKGMDYNEGGARYNTSYIQGVGIGTVTDSLAAIRTAVFEERTAPMGDLLDALATDFDGRAALRQRLLNRAPKWGNDDALADGVMQGVFGAFVDAIDGRPNVRGGTYGVDMLPTTCHVYFGGMTGATPDGRLAGTPLSEGISPTQGADRLGPTAVLRSAAKMDQARTCGTLLNMKMSPGVIEGDEGIAKLANLVRTYFGMGGHHIQFNVVNVKTLREAQADPDAHRDLIVRVAGYSDYFCDLSRELQDEIIARTEHAAV